MGMFGKLVKGSALMTAARMVQREAAKPENRKKINDAMARLRSRRSGGPAPR